MIPLSRWSLSLFVISVAVLPASSQRDAVLRQINEPHPYYFREMYLPQVTTGPSSVTWGPDGKEVIFAMDGMLWRRLVGAGDCEAIRTAGRVCMNVPSAGSLALQLTDGGHGYDFQPDWSPHGGRVVFVRYEHDAMELELLDPATGVVTPLTHNGAVNVEPRWSPDGERIAFVTTMFEGRFNVAIVDVATGAIHRVTSEHDSRLPRYYYSVYDQYLSPTWSPDGRELILISNRGHIWGSGTFWRLPLDAPDSMREIHDEETTWRARPDWSRDGRRVVYSSYVGRQRHQLWLMTADGGHPFQLTYGDFDATNARWSPDGSRIAYISNETGNTSLWIVDVPGGQRTRLSYLRTAWKRPRQSLTITVSAAGGSSPDARISITTVDGRNWAPSDALRRADDSFDRHERPFELGYFHATARSWLWTPRESLTVLITKGLEFAPEERHLAPARSLGLSVRLRRIANLPAQGWYSGDLHVHMNYGGHYLVTPTQLAFQMRAEDLHVVENLIVNKEERIPDIAWFTGTPDAASRPGTLIVSGQEYHTSYWGHTGLLGITDHVLVPAYAAYAGTAAASLAPLNATVFALARRQHGVTGYVHEYDGVVDPADSTVPLHHELPVDVALGLVDYMEILGFADHRSTEAVWHRLLNCGFRIPAGAGTDAMTNYASLRGPVGLDRVYVKSGSPLTHERFLAALKAGKTFATNGPLLELSVNGRDIGSAIALPNGASKVTVKARMRSIVAVDHVELVVNGKVVDSLPLSADRKNAAGTRTITVSTSSWVTLRAWSAHAQAPILDIYPFATTSPIYLTVGGRPQRSATDTKYFLAWLTRLDASNMLANYDSPAELAEAQALFARARVAYTKRLEEAMELNAP